MDLILEALPALVSSFLLIFGAIVLWKGVRIIFDFYPKTLTFQNSRNQNKGTTLSDSLAELIDAQITELKTVQIENREQRTIRNRVGETDQDGTTTPPAEETSPETQKTLLDGIAVLTSAIKDLLGANFGPAALLILTGLAMLAGGVWLIYIDLLA